MFYVTTRFYIERVTAASSFLIYETCNGNWFQYLERNEERVYVAVKESMYNTFQNHTVHGFLLFNLHRNARIHSSGSKITRQHKTTRRQNKWMPVITMN